MAEVGWRALSVNVWSQEAREGAEHGLVDGAGDASPPSSSVHMKGYRMLDQFLTRQRTRNPSNSG